MINTSYSVDVTGINQDNLLTILQEYAKENETSNWDMETNPKIFGQQVNSKGTYSKGGADYQTKIISPPFSISPPKSFLPLAKTLREKRGVANKSCRFYLRTDTTNLNQMQIINCISEMLPLENYLAYILGESTIFEKSDLKQFHTYLKNEDAQNEIDQIQSLISCIPYLTYEENILEFCYSKYIFDEDSISVLDGLISLFYHLQNKAVARKSCLTPKIMEEENQKYTFRTFLVRLGMNGNVYADTRKILTKNLTGNSAHLKPKINKP